MSLNKQDNQLVRKQVKICGEEYTLKSKCSPEYMERVAQLVDDTMKKVSQNKPRLSLHQTAVLAALNLADEYLKLEVEYANLMEMLEETQTEKGGEK